MSHFRRAEIKQSARKNPLRVRAIALFGGNYWSRTARRTKRVHLAVLQGRRAVTLSGGASCGARGRRLVTDVPGRLGHQPAGTMTGARGARCNWVRHRRHVRFVWCTYSGKPGPSCALGTTTPFGESRGGTPEDVLPPPFPPPHAGEDEGGGSAAARKAAEVTEQRLTAFRFLLFLLL